ncbi:MAG TPA: hypothetical protein VEU47_15505 [Candidatus Cybelea sp.]|nr:hypothetical protein [Candidatus Cybelea sp.]
MYWRVEWIDPNGQTQAFQIFSLYHARDVAQELSAACVWARVVDSKGAEFYRFGKLDRQARSAERSLVA